MPVEELLLRAPEAKRVGREQLRETTASHELPTTYLLAEAAFEALDEDILHRFAGRNAKP